MTRTDIAARVFIIVGNIVSIHVDPPGIICSQIMLGLLTGWAAADLAIAWIRR